jgi:hypothetical protein
MPFLTGGHVQYTRRVKTGDYEHKDVVVLLNWAAQEGESGAEAFASKVHDMARSECERIVAGKPAEVAQAQPAGQSDAPKRGPGRPPKVQATDTALSVVETIPITPAIDDLDAPAAKSAAKVEDDLGDVTGAQQLIDDKTLVDHITHTNQRIKNAPAIRGLIAEFVGPPPATAAKIPQERRQEFINRLEGLK